MLIGLYEEKNHIDFGFNRLKVKVTLFVHVKLVSAQNLENHLSQNLHISHVIVLYEDMIPIEFGFNRLKVKVTEFKLILAFLI